MAYEEENLNQFPTALSLQHDVLFLDNACLQRNPNLPPIQYILQLARMSQYLLETVSLSKPRSARLLPFMTS